MTNLARTKTHFFLAATMSLCIGAPALGQVITEDFKLFPFLATDGNIDGILFGSHLALSNNILVVGAPGFNASDSNTDAGAVYLYNAITGASILKLIPFDGDVNDRYGSAVDIDNGVVAVGSPQDDDNGDFSGSAYIFDIAASIITKLLPNDGAPGDSFGTSIAISNGIVAVGASGNDENGQGSGAVYLFDAFTGVQLFKIIPTDLAPGDNFGRAIALSKTTLAVGSWKADAHGADSGAAYLFNTQTGTQTHKLLPTDGSAGDWFGVSIDIDSGIVVVGALTTNEHGSNDGGSAYVFDASTGTQTAKLRSNDIDPGDWFGNTVAMDSGIILIGASGDRDLGFFTGSAYIFDATNGNQIAKLLPSDGAADNWFGSGIAIDNAQIAIGSPGNDDIGHNSGSAHVFSMPKLTCPADLTGDNLLNFFDISAFLLAFNANDPAADFNGDGLYNFFDISAFLVAFTAGCP